MVWISAGSFTIICDELAPNLSTFPYLAYLCQVVGNHYPMLTDGLSFAERWVTLGWPL